MIVAITEPVVSSPVKTLHQQSVISGSRMAEQVSSKSDELDENSQFGKRPARKKRSQPEKKSKRNNGESAARGRATQGTNVTQTLSLRMREGLMFAWLILAAFLTLALLVPRRLDLWCC